MPIKLRLTFWYCFIFGTIMGAVITIIYYFHGQAHYKEVDRLLSNVSSHVHEEILKQLNEGKQLEKVQLFIGDLALNGIAVWVKNTNGTLIETNSHKFLGSHPLLSKTSDIYSNSTETITNGKNERIRVQTTPIQQNGATIGYIQSFYSLKDLDQALWRFKWMVIALSGIGMIFALFAGWFLAKKTLERVDLIRKTAKTIAVSHDFHQRVLHHGPLDELGKLTETFNDMLESLEKVYTNQKRFLSDASHELRAPLTTIQGNLDILHRVKHIPDKEKSEILEDMRSEAIRMSKLVSNLLSLARADAGQITRMDIVDLSSVSKTVVAEIQLWEKTVEIKADIAEGIRIWADENLIKQFLLILIDNAIKYTSEGLVSIKITKENEQAAISIKDTGIGIEKEELPFIFERFYRAQAARRNFPAGTGLGLSIAKRIVDEHHGSMVLTSVPGTGTEITTYFSLL